MRSDARSAANILLLQGPVGGFFARLATTFEARGATVTKVNFNAGDSLFFRGKRAHSYRGPKDQWPAFFRRLIEKRHIDTIFLNGDCRWMHKSVIPIARERGIAVWVFEEGYLRPDHVTMEPYGVNGNSSMSKDPSFYRAEAAKVVKPTPAEQVGNTFYALASRSILYTIALAVGSVAYPHYEHHRDLRLFHQSFAWVRSAWRKQKYKWREKGMLERAVGEWSGRYFLVPLQLHCDFQITHSDYESIPAFIEEVLETFAASAPADTQLVFKHHPLDRAYRDYTKLLAELSEKFGAKDRVHYIHDQHLPTMLKHARGVVTMNSTVGTSALYHGAPVKVMGRAIYNIPELTYQASLASFFATVEEVDSELFEAFNTWMREENQFNGSFYKVVDGVTLEQVIVERVLAAREMLAAVESSVAR